MDTTTDDLATTNGTKLPAMVHVDLANMSVSPNELRYLKATTGRTMEDLMGEEADEADRLQAMVLLQLRRDGHTATWDEAGEVGIGFAGEPPKSDPTPTDTTPSSLGSAVSGE